MGMGMKSLKWEGIGTKNLFPHTSTLNVSSTRRATDASRRVKASNMTGYDLGAFIFLDLHY